MNKLTVLIIQSRGDDIKCSFGGPIENGKYVGWISLFNGDEYDRELVSSDPIFDTADEAVNHMAELVRNIRTIGIA